MAVLLQDDFNRSNNTSTPGTPAVGGPYTATAGTWGISTNQLYLSATVAPAYLLAPGASDVDFTVTLPLANAGSAGPHSGLVWRAADANNQYSTYRSSTGNFAIQHVIGGASAQVSPEMPSLAGDVHRVVCFEKFMYYYVNSLLVWTQEDTNYIPASNTKIGFRNGQTNTGRWDNALAIDVTADPYSWGSSAQMADPTLNSFSSFGSAYNLTPSLYKGRDTAAADESEIP